ncbi:uncharacterized protein LOC135378916 [Ornithodoros turicata]|uniref:uncharacterized protein LOC135378916 n=1 Tax=Ornithodoros turicata TaxID=34597 RepID=UPI003139A22D
MKRRKRYLDPQAEGQEMPKSTQHVLRRRSENTADVAEPSTSRKETSAEEEDVIPVQSDSESIQSSEFYSAAEISSSDDSDAISHESDANVSQSSTTSDFLLEFATPLQSGSSMSVGDALVLIMDFSTKHGLSWTATEDLLKLVNNLLGVSGLPQSKHLFRKFCGATPDNMTFNFYCPDCGNFLQKTTGHQERRHKIKPKCSICGKQHSGHELMDKGSYFVALPVEKQLAAVLSDSHVQQSVSETLERLESHVDGVFADFTDGEYYRRQREVLSCSKYDLTLSVNADGSPMFKSANYSIWPVQLTINEMAPHLRWQFIVVPLLWYGAHHPNMTLLLEAFATQMQNLARDGIPWIAAGQHVKSKVYCISCVADAPARAAMANMVQYNGYYGCTWCLHPGVCVEGCVKYPVTIGAVPERTARGTAEDMSAAAASQRTVRGVKGPSPLLNVPGFDIVWAFRPDYMHCALLGVTRQFLELWFGNRGEEYYIGQPQTLSKVNNRIVNIKPPQCINRPPRDLSLRKYWKASECQSWLLYYCLPCVINVLPKKYCQHFALLVSGLHLLLKSHVTYEDVEESTEKITEFVVKVHFLYGETQMTSNVHTLLHLPKSTLLHGPLWALSCFAFESNIGHLLKLVSSSNGVPFQILSRILIRNNYLHLQSMASRDVQLLCHQRLHQRHYGVDPVGKPLPPSQFLRDLVQEHCGEAEVREYHRVKVGGYILHSEAYTRPQKRDSTAFKLEDYFAKAQHIVSVKRNDNVEKFYVLSHLYKTDNFIGIKNISVAERLPSRRLLELTKDMHPCMYLQVEHTTYFAELCNRHEWW